MTETEPHPHAASAWLQFLPAALHPGYLERIGADPTGEKTRQLLDLLPIFEAVLDGRDDAPEVSHDVVRDGIRTSHSHAALGVQVDRMHELFDPWKTPAPLLPWLAGWLDLEFPSLQGTVLWDEYQQRKVTAEIAGSHRLRGLRSGVTRALQLYGVGRFRTRIAIDDGSRVLQLAPRDDGQAAVTAMVSDGLRRRGGKPTANGIYRPTCVALAPGNRLVVADNLPESGSEGVQRLWLLDASGHYAQPSRATGPRPLASGAESLVSTTPIVGLACSTATGTSEERLFVLNEAGNLFLVKGLHADAPASKVSLAAGAAGAAKVGVAMVMDREGKLLILRRGSPSSSGNVKPELLEIKPDGTSPSVHPLNDVVHPLSMTLGPGQTVFIGDGGPQVPTNDQQKLGNVVRVTRRTTGAWLEEPLLPKTTGTTALENPLVSPTGIECADDGTYLHVVDVGLKPFVADRERPYVAAVTEPAAVYRIDLPSASAVRVSDLGGLVYPRGMVRRGERLVLVDHGYPPVGNEIDSGARGSASRFEVVVHFHASDLVGLTTDEDRAARRRINGNISTIIDQHKPAHTARILRTST